MGSPSPLFLCVSELKAWGLQEVAEDRPDLQLYSSVDSQYHRAGGQSDELADAALRGTVGGVEKEPNRLL